jgi:hypothetical protein
VASAPLIGDWWQICHDEIVARAMSAMRMDHASDPDRQWLSECAIAIGHRIDAYLDRCTPLPVYTPAPILYAAVEGTVVLYRRKDTPFGTTGGWADNAVSTPIYSDPLEGLYPMLAPYKERLGVA